MSEDNVKLAIEKIIANKALLKEFEQINDIEELYNYTVKFGGGQFTVSEFVSYVIKLYKEAGVDNKMLKDDLLKVSGGKSSSKFTKVLAASLAALSIAPLASSIRTSAITAPPKAPITQGPNKGGTQAKPGTGGPAKGAPAKKGGLFNLGVPATIGAGAAAVGVTGAIGYVIGSLVAGTWNPTQWFYNLDKYKADIDSFSSKETLTDDELNKLATILSKYDELMKRFDKAKYKDLRGNVDTSLGKFNSKLKTYLATKKDDLKAKIKSQNSKLVDADIDKVIAKLNLGGINQPQQPKRLTATEQQDLEKKLDTFLKDVGINLDNLGDLDTQCGTSLAVKESDTATIAEGLNETNFDEANIDLAALKTRLIGDITALKGDPNKFIGQAKRDIKEEDLEKIAKMEGITAAFKYQLQLGLLLGAITREGATPEKVKSLLAKVNAAKEETKDSVAKSKTSTQKSEETQLPRKAPKQKGLDEPPGILPAEPKGEPVDPNQPKGEDPAALLAANTEKWKAFFEFAPAKDAKADLFTPHVDLVLPFLTNLFKDPKVEEVLAADVITQLTTYLKDKVDDKVITAEVLKKTMAQLVLLVEQPKVKDVYTIAADKIVKHKEKSHHSDPPKQSEIADILKEVDAIPSLKGKKLEPFNSAVGTLVLTDVVVTGEKLYVATTAKEGDTARFITALDKLCLNLTKGLEKPLSTSTELAKALIQNEEVKAVIGTKETEIAGIIDKFLPGRVSKYLKGTAGLTITEVSELANGSAILKNLETLGRYIYITNDAQICADGKKINLLEDENLIQLKLNSTKIQALQLPASTKSLLTNISTIGLGAQPADRPTKLKEAVKQSNLIAVDKGPDKTPVDVSAVDGQDDINEVIKGQLLEIKLSGVKDIPVKGSNPTETEGKRKMIYAPGITKQFKIGSLDAVGPGSINGHQYAIFLDQCSIDELTEMSPDRIRDILTALQAMNAVTALSNVVAQSFTIAGDVASGSPLTLVSDKTKAEHTAAFIKTNFLVSSGHQLLIRDSGTKTLFGKHELKGLVALNVEESNNEFLRQYKEFAHGGNVPTFTVGTPVAKSTTLFSLVDGTTSLDFDLGITGDLQDLVVQSPSQISTGNFIKLGKHLKAKLGTQISSYNNYTPGAAPRLRQVFLKSGLNYELATLYSYLITVGLVTTHGKNDAEKTAAELGMIKSASPWVELKAGLADTPAKGWASTTKERAVKALADEVTECTGDDSGSTITATDSATSGATDSKYNKLFTVENIKDSKVAQLYILSAEDAMSTDLGKSIHTNAKSTVANLKPQLLTAIFG